MIYYAINGKLPTFSSYATYNAATELDDEEIYACDAKRSSLLTCTYNTDLLACY